MQENIFDRISFWSLFLVIVLLPIFCLPFTSVPIETSKGLLLVVGLTLCVIFWAIGRFFDGKISLPKSFAILTGFGIALAFLLSAFVSSASQVSFFGTMFDLGTFWFIFAAILLMFFCSIFFKNVRNARILLSGTVLSSAFVLMFQIAHLFLPTVLSLGILADKTDNILGSWNALGLFAGFAAITLLILIEFFPVERIGKWVLKFFLLLSIILIAAVNFTLVWELVGISALIIFVYKISIHSRSVASAPHEGEPKKMNFPLLSFVIVMLALLFFMSGTFIGGWLPNRLGLSNNEVNPSFSATMMVTTSALKQNPILGVGPNRFDEVWALYKPAEINQTPFWNVSFNSGSGLLPTFASTTGILGIFFWLLFFMFLITAGVKSLFSSIKSGMNFEMVAFFVMSLYFFVSSFFYSAGSVIFLLALAFAGVFIGLSYASLGKEISVSFLNDHRKSFFSILLLVVVIILSAATAFKYIERFASVPYFGKTLNATNIPDAETNINKALSLYTNDLYLRSYAQVYLLKLNSIVAKGSSTLSQQDQADLKDSFNNAVSGAQAATTYDPKSYLNFVMLASVEQAAGEIGVKDGYTDALTAYQNALVLNPLNPSLKLGEASASFANGDIKGAKDEANAALVLKPDYTDALVTLSQIAKSEGDMTNALSYAQTALSYDPTNQDLIDYTNSLKTPSAPTVSPVSNTSTTTPPPPAKKK